MNVRVLKDGRVGAPLAASIDGKRQRLELGCLIRPRRRHVGCGGKGREAEVVVAFNDGGANTVGRRMQEEGVKLRLRHEGRCCTWAKESIE